MWHTRAYVLPHSPLLPMATSRKRLRSTGEPDLYDLMEQLQTLRHQNETLSSKVEAMGVKKHRGHGCKTGTVPWRYLMNALQRFYDQQQRGENYHAPLSPGHESRQLLLIVTDRFMKELDGLSHQHGYDWRKVPDRPHAKPLTYNVDKE